MLRSKSFLAAFASLLVVFFLLISTSTRYSFEEEQSVNFVEFIPPRREDEEFDKDRGVTKRVVGKDGEDQEEQCQRRNCAEEVMRTYLKHRDDGLTLEEIADRVFKVSFPNSDWYRTHSYPFVSGDTFRAYADVVVERERALKDVAHQLFRVNFPKSKVGGKKRRHHRERKFLDGDIIFVKTDLVDQFAKMVLPQMRTSFVLVTHNSDIGQPERNTRAFKMLESPLLLHWFAQNPPVSHPKLTAIPIGLENRHYNRSGNIYRLEKIFRRAPPFFSPADPASGSARPTLIYSNFNVETNKKERKRAAKMFSAVADSDGKKLDLEEYWERLARSKFVLSPPGNGLDCHRTYESLLLGAVPVVKNSTLFPVFAEAPVLVLTDWKSVAGSSAEQTLLNFEARAAEKGRTVLMAQHWFDKMEEARKDVLR